MVDNCRSSQAKLFCRMQLQWKSRWFRNVCLNSISLQMSIFVCNKFNHSFFAVLLSPVLDGFDQPIKLNCTVLMLSINSATSRRRKIFLGMPRFEPGAAGLQSANATTVLCRPAIVAPAFLIGRKLSEEPWIRTVVIALRHSGRRSRRV